MDNNAYIANDFFVSLKDRHQAAPTTKQLYYKQLLCFLVGCLCNKDRHPTRKQRSLSVCRTSACTCACRTSASACRTSTLLVLVGTVIPTVPVSVLLASFCFCRAARGRKLIDPMFHLGQSLHILSRTSFFYLMRYSFCSFLVFFIYS